jgi:hypothetical protein
MVMHNNRSPYNSEEHAEEVARGFGLYGRAAEEPLMGGGMIRLDEA